MDELDALAGERFGNGKRDALTSPVETTDGAIQLTLELASEGERRAISLAIARESSLQSCPRNKPLKLFDLIRAKAVRSWIGSPTKNLVAYGFTAVTMLQ